MILLQSFREEALEEEHHTKKEEDHTGEVVHQAEHTVIDERAEFFSADNFKYINREKDCQQYTDVNEHLSGKIDIRVVFCAEAHHTEPVKNDHRVGEIQD
ncbi:MAG: hypothetical protein K0R65_1159 [Crocinitomicaceae bacterium]|nr:hypothetical protein [Crocinitomicaceae bacterium]